MNQSTLKHFTEEDFSILVLNKLKEVISETGMINFIAKDIYKNNNAINSVLEKEYVKRVTMSVLEELEEFLKPSPTISEVVESSNDNLPF